MSLQSIARNVIILAFLGCRITAAGELLATDPSAKQVAPPFKVEVTGSGRSMILIPGLGNSGAVWNATVARFKSTYECHVVTLAGFAGQPAIEPPFLPAVRDALLDYIREHNLKRPIIVGHSLGGFLALWLGSTEPDLMGPIIAVDGVPFLPELMNSGSTVESGRAQTERIRQSMASMTQEQDRVQIRMVLSGMLIKSPENVEFVARGSADSSPAAFAQAMYELMSTDLRTEVGRIQSPVLLIGAGDFAKSPVLKKVLTAAYESQIASIPHHRFVLAENARHFIMLDDPDFFYTTVEAFLKNARALDGAVTGATP